MKCLICDERMEFSFSKQFTGLGLSKVDYWRCPNCGFTMSRTHAEMTIAEWESLNHEYHASYQRSESNPDDPRWIARLKSQSKVISDMTEHGLISGKGRWLDYACGDGKLSKLLERKGLTLLKYDRYMARNDGYLDAEELIPGDFAFVVTTSVFEHLRLREHFDSIESLVADNGVFGVHTMVCETIPRDPNWFYLLPVHCAFHTNKSMRLLMHQWGYVASTYHVDSRLWFWFKQQDQLEQRIDYMNKRSDEVTFHYKQGFVDYWK